MIKKLLTMTMLLIAAVSLNAQTPLPLNPDVKHGVLPNGLNYYILHNEEPKERVNFYIAQKVGSTLEAPDQLGLAHFLEHMAFNGTKNYPGKNMLNYLQSKGIRFGADINAYTAFDETVYNINNVPSSDKALVDSVLLVLYDWSGSILLEESEINAERGVIQEEWRSRNDANQRMYEAMLPAIYSEYQYQQMPIGKMEVVATFPPQAIRDYYHKWYRPDQQGIVIVGDIDADEMEQKVINLFSSIPMPENAAERVYPEVSDNEEPIYFYFKDKELRFPRIMVSFKSDKIPFEYRNTVEAYMQTEIVEELIDQMIQNRLDEASKKPDCKFAYAGVSFGDFYVSKTKAAFNIIIVAKDDVKAAYDEVLAIVARACKTGFMESELVRSRDQLLANYEKAYNERNNTNSDTRARELIRAFVDNEAAPGIESEYQLAKQLLPMIPVQAYNEAVKSLLTPNNQVIVVSEPEKEGMMEITKDEMVQGLNNAINADYEAYVDEVITDPLIAKLPKPGKVTSVKEGEYGTSEFVLSNGVKVVVKPTDFKQDEILFTAFKEGGKNIYSASDANYVNMAEDAYSSSKLGNFTRTTLDKYLAGKNVSLSFNIGNTATSLDGTSTVKDLKYLMELVYSSFTALNPDQEAYDASMNQAISLLKNSENTPMYQFQIHLNKAMYGNNPMFEVPTVESIQKGDYMKELAIVKNALNNAAEYTMLFVGNIDAATLQPMLEQYIATLPATKKIAPVKTLSDVNIVPGQVVDDFTMPMQVPSTLIMDVVSGDNLVYNVDNEVKISLFGQILRMIFTDTLREEEGGTYSPYASANMNPYNNKWMLMYQFQTNAEMQDRLRTRADEEMLKLLNEGASEDHFARGREAQLKQYDIQVRTNKYWENKLMLKLRGHDDIADHKAAIENLTRDGFNSFLKNLYNGKNRIQVMMQGVAQ